MEIINWKELLYPYEQAVEELLLKFKNLDKECRHLGIYSPVDSVTGRLKTPASILDKAGRKHIAFPHGYDHRAGEGLHNKYEGERLPQLPHHHPLSAQHGAGAEGGFRGNSDSHKRNEFLGNGGAFPAV